MLKNLLNEKKDSILESWYLQILESYPAEGAQFIKSKKDRFSNPIGFTISTEIKTVYDQILTDMDYQTLHGSLEKIIKIRAVQEFTSSQAIAFIFLLKKAIRDNLEAELTDHSLLRQLTVFEAKIDQVALVAFDIYSQSREKMFEVRLNEYRRQSIHFFRHTEADKDSQ